MNLVRGHHSTQYTISFTSSYKYNAISLMLKRVPFTLFLSPTTTYLPYCTKLFKGIVYVGNLQFLSPYCLLYSLLNISPPIAPFQTMKSLHVASFSGHIWYLFIWHLMTFDSFLDTLHLLGWQDPSASWFFLKLHWMLFLNFLCLFWSQLIDSEIWCLIFALLLWWFLSVLCF